MKKHHLYLEKNDWFDISNKHDETIMHLSFLMMHSLSEGFSIKLFSCTHNTKSKKPGLPHGNCQGNLSSEDACEGQPKGYSLSNVISECYNHIPKENENSPLDGGKCPSSSTSRQYIEEKTKAKKTKQRKSSKKKMGFKEQMKKHHLYLEKKWVV